MQFTAYRNTDPGSGQRVPCLLVVQSDLIDTTRTCVVVPLITPERAGVPVSRLMPALKVGDNTMIMDTLQLAAVPRAMLGGVAADLSAERMLIIEALDLLISGI
jgi:toxin CcdB